MACSIALPSIDQAYRHAPINLHGYNAPCQPDRIRLHQCDYAGAEQHSDNVFRGAVRLAALIAASWRDPAGMRSLPHLGGILLGFAILMSSAVFGLGSVVAQWPWLVIIVRVFGAAWLAWMSLRYFLAGMHGPEATAASAPAPISRPFRFHEGVLFQWVNPRIRRR
jgi:hypothetical protein